MVDHLLNCEIIQLPSLPHLMSILWKEITMSSLHSSDENLLSTYLKEKYLHGLFYSA
jgi:hypothetical protein